MSDGDEVQRRRDEAYAAYVAARPEEEQPRSSVPAGWYPHPRMAGTQRYWDGAQWTEHVAPSQPRGPAPDAGQGGDGGLMVGGYVAAVIFPIAGLVIAGVLAWRRRAKHALLVGGLSLTVIAAISIGLTSWYGDNGASGNLFSSGEIDDAYLETAIEKWFLEEVRPGAARVSVDCPDGVAVDPGREFVCLLTDRADTIGVRVTIQNNDGDVVWQLE